MWWRPRLIAESSTNGASAVQGATWRVLGGWRAQWGRVALHCLDDS